MSDSSSSFAVADDTRGDDSPLIAADSSAGGLYNLSWWLPAAATQSLTIPTSRWFHDLWLHEVSGREYPVQKIATQGDVSGDASGQAWWNDYASLNI